MRIVAGEVEATVKALTSSIEPLMIVVVGGIVIAMYMPVFKILELVKWPPRESRRKLFL